MAHWVKLADIRFGRKTRTREIIKKDSAIDASVITKRTSNTPNIDPNQILGSVEEKKDSNLQQTDENGNQRPQTDRSTFGKKKEWQTTQITEPEYQTEDKLIRRKRGISAG